MPLVPAGEQSRSLTVPEHHQEKNQATGNPAARRRVGDQQLLEIPDPAAHSVEKVPRDGEVNVSTGRSPEKAGHLSSQRQDSLREQSKPLVASNLQRRWQEFVQTHSDLKVFRIHADQHRRQTRRKREAFKEDMKQYSLLAQSVILNLSKARVQELTALSHKMETDRKEFEVMEHRVDSNEDQIIRMESKIGEFLPVIEGNPDKVPAELMYEGFRQLAEESDSSRGMSSDDDETGSPEFQRYSARLTEVDEIRDKLDELRLDDNRLRQKNPFALEEKDRQLLRSYPSERSRLRAQLEWAQDDIRRLKTLPSLQREIAR